MSLLSNIAVSAVSGAAAAGAISMVSYVQLQTSSPGTTELGHTHIAGYSLANRFGAGANPTLARVQVLESGSLQGVRSETASGVAVFGKNTAATGLGFGGYFTSTSNGGRAVVGDALSGTGNTIGGLFYNRSSGGGVGVYGRAIGGGTATGVFGDTTSATGTALAAANLATSDELQAAGPNGSLLTKGVLPKHQYTVSTSAAMVPLAYGVVSGAGAILMVGTNNWTVSRLGTGQYSIDVQGIAFGPEEATVVAMPFETGGTQFCTAASTADDFGINVYDASIPGFTDSDFYFVVYRSGGFELQNAPGGLSDPQEKRKYGSLEKWSKKDPSGFERWRKSFVAWQRKQLETRQSGLPLDETSRP